jgi:hypothetical protein
MSVKKHYNIDHSASSEPTFSSAGNIATDAQTLLSSGKVENLVFIKDNFDKLPSLSWELDKSALDDAERRNRTREGKLFTTVNNVLLMGNTFQLRYLSLKIMVQLECFNIDNA